MKSRPPQVSPFAASVPAAVSERQRIFCRSAFTLIELLCALVIVLLLAALAMGGIGLMRDQAAMARCTANLRQLQGLSLIWAQDNDGWVPQAMWSVKNKAYGATNLRDYGLKVDSLYCNSMDNAIAPSYGINNTLLRDGSSNPWGSGDVYFWHHGAYRFADLAPRTLLFTETIVLPGWSTGGASAYVSTKDSASKVHGNRVLVVYVDGSTESREWQDMVDKKAWNEGIGAI